MTLPRALAAALAAAVLVAAPTAAYADTIVRTDKAGDVASQVGDDAATPAPTRTNGDIVDTRITHAAGAVRIRIRHTDLARKGTVVTLIPIRSDKGFRYVNLIARPGAYAGRALLTKADGVKVACKGVTRSINYATNVTRLSVPRSCLGNPNWVRVGVGVISTENGFKTSFLDDARTNGDVDTPDPLLSPRIYR